MAELFHITERLTWLDAVQVGEYRMSKRGVTLAYQGFIHCSLGHQLPGVARLVYGDVADSDLVVLAIDDSRVPAVIRYEPTEAGGQAYPHIYGPLPIGAVTDAFAMSRDSSAGLVLPA